MLLGALLYVPLAVVQAICASHLSVSLSCFFFAQTSPCCSRLWFYLCGHLFFQVFIWSSAWSCPEKKKKSFVDSWCGFVLLYLCRRVYYPTSLPFCNLLCIWLSKCLFLFRSCWLFGFKLIFVLHLVQLVFSSVFVYIKEHQIWFELNFNKKSLLTKRRFRLTSKKLFLLKNLVMFLVQISIISSILCSEKKPKLSKIFIKKS